MFSVIVLGILAIGMAAVAGYSILSMMQSTSTSIQSIDENRIIERWSTAILLNSKSLGPSGEVYPPYGRDFVDGGTSYHALPAWMGLDTLNSYGKELVYCPYGPETTIGGTTSVPMTTSTSYNVNKITSNGRDFVSASDVPPVTGVIAFIMSETSGASSHPTCNEVVYVGGRYETTSGNGVVRAVTYEDASMVVNDRLLSVDLGDTIGADVNGLVNDSLTKWPVTEPSRTVVYVPNRVDPYKIADLSLISSRVSTSKELIIRGESKAGVTLISSGATNPQLSFSGIDVKLESLTVNPSILISVDDGKLVLSDVDVGPISVDNGAMELIGTNTVRGNAAASSPIKTDNSEVSLFAVTLNIDGAVTDNFSIEALTSKWRVESASLISVFLRADIQALAFSDRTLVQIDSSTVSIDADTSIKPVTALTIGDLSSLILKNSTISLIDLSESTLLTLGDAVIDGGVFSYAASADNGILIGTKGSLELKGGFVLGGATPALQPTKSILDLGGRSISGISATVNGTSNCWEGNLFTSVASQSSGTSAPTVPEYSIANRSSWTCNP